VRRGLQTIVDFSLMIDGSSKLGTELEELVVLRLCQRTVRLLRSAGVSETEMLKLMLNHGFALTPAELLSAESMESLAALMQPQRN
jgi:hypothetical protein